MTITAAHPPQGPVPPPGTPPGPYDPPGPTPQPIPPTPPRQDGREPTGPTNLKASKMYPGMKSWRPEEHCSHRASGTPVRAIMSHR